jgi:hypothetical protein
MENDMKAVFMLLFALAMIGFSAPHIARAQDQDTLQIMEDPSSVTVEDSAAAYRAILMTALAEIDTEIARLQAHDMPALSSVMVIPAGDVVEEAGQAALGETVEANSEGIERLRNLLNTSEEDQPAGILKDALETNGVAIDEVIALAVREDGEVVIFTAPTS